MRLRAATPLTLAVALGIPVAIAAANPQAELRTKSFEYDSDGAQAHASAKKIDSRVNIAGSTGGVTGSVNSSNRNCEKRRLASLVLVTTTGIQFLDTEKTTMKGAFSLEGAVSGQAHIVGVGKKTVTKFRLGRPPKKLLCSETESEVFVP
jgi:hypothetical protein